MAFPFVATFKYYAQLLNLNMAQAIDFLILRVGKDRKVKDKIAYRFLGNELLFILVTEKKNKMF